jgi:hypothetical protein
MTVQYLLINIQLRFTLAIGCEAERIDAVTNC